MADVAFGNAGHDRLQPAGRAGGFMDGGALFGTASDFMRFLRLNDGMGDNGRVFRPETVAVAARHNSSQSLISLARLRRSGSGAIGFGRIRTATIRAGAGRASPRRRTWIWCSWRVRPRSLLRRSGFLMSTMACRPTADLSTPVPFGRSRVVRILRFTLLPDVGLAPALLMVRGKGRISCRDF